jgi:dipeptidase D
MKNPLQDLEPKAVWENFAQLNAVPRPSKKEDRVIAFVMDFGKALGLETLRDTVGNVIIRKPATTGMADRKMVTLQSHLDMVHQKNEDTLFDFEREGIAMVVDGDWVKAKGTTLGADNGLGVAAIMALLQSTDIPHPALEALFTIDEETGMTGAFGLQPGFLKGEILLNLDTEEDDEIDVGCAGGIDVTAKGTYQEIVPDVNSIFYEITVKGLCGGHSGMDIHKGLGNANKIMNRILYHLDSELGIQISQILGGGLRNAIPRESRAVLVSNSKDGNQLKSVFKEQQAQIKKELELQEPKLDIQLKLVNTEGGVMPKIEQTNLLNTLYAAHNGVYAMSMAMPGVVETSNNVAKVNVKGGTVEIGCLTRSSVESAKIDLAHALKASFELGGFVVNFSGAYPGWRPNPNSEILKTTEKVYTELFQESPRIVACHAGLECGILGQHYPELDMVSFGPTILGAHSPDERVSIPSVQKFWTFLLQVLQNIPMVA